MATPFQLSDRLVDELIELDPIFATSLGVDPDSVGWGDQGPEGFAARHELHRRYEAEFRRHIDHPDRRERIAARVLAASLAERIAAYEDGEHLTDVAHMASSFQRYTHVFDLMPKTTPADWEAIATRLATIDTAFAGVRRRLELGRTSGRTVAQRQVESVIDQATGWMSQGGGFDALVATAPDHMFDRTAGAVRLAKSATSDFVAYLAADYLPDATIEDGVGQAAYRRRAARLVGTNIDPHEAYEWGWGEFARLVAVMEEVAREISPGASFAEAKELLETDSDRAAPSREAFRDFIARRQEQALAALDGAHFDVAEPLRVITVDFAPRSAPLGAFYMRPSEDFSRPGAIRYSVGDQEIFPLYHHVSTAYHEGFPGHHLQSGTAMVNADRISRAHRLAVRYPGYGEGWALYAERLMHELGYYELPDYHFGMLAKHLYRATRVVVDIGLHLGLALPATAPLGAGERWTFERAAEYLRTYGFRTPAQSVGEVLRYLGWPGQAIAYKLGERELLSIRAEARRRNGSDFDLKRFHAHVIGQGPMRFDLLRSVVLDGLDR